jgi:mono/diheme cytochrome c family protein
VRFLFSGGGENTGLRPASQGACHAMVFAELTRINGYRVRSCQLGSRADYEVHSMKARFAVVACFVSCLALGGAAPASAQEDAVAQGHHLATLICSACHVAAPDQSFAPILQPPASPFVSIAQRSNVTADFLRTFLTTTHRDISNPRGMPNPQLLDYQIEQISAYVLSLRKRP